MDKTVDGLREAKALIAQALKTLRDTASRSSNPYIRGRRDALKEIEKAISDRIKGYSPVDNPPKSIA